jgi:hypothetical protein
MVKYTIEDNINFWDELNSNDNDNDNDNDNFCLISKQKLLDNYIKLPCSHTFNYKTLFNEIKNFKYNKYLYYSNIKLQNNQIICPYCRTVINNLLPFIPSLIPDKINYVNYPLKYCLPLYKCKYSYKNKNCQSNNAYINNNNTFCEKHHLLIEKKNYYNNLTPEMKKYSKNYKVKDIKNILKSNKLKCSGLKNELVIRIFENKLN